MEDQIDEIKNALRSFIEGLIARGQPISPELREALTATIQHVERRISALRNEQEIPAGSERLWALSGGNPQAFQSYLGNYPSSGLNQISQNPGRVSNIEQRLGNQITFPSGESAAGIPKAQLNSSNVYGFSYDPRNKKMKVRFQEGSIYNYDDVPPLIFKAFQAGAIPARTKGKNKFGEWWIGKKPSLGASFFNLIRDRFPYQKVA